MNVLITGANGFIGRNLYSHLDEVKDISIDTYTRDDSNSTLNEKVAKTDFIVHLAGVNRPEHTSEFDEVNTDLTRQLCEIAAGQEKNIPILFSSSIQVDTDSLYGKSKMAAENILSEYSSQTGSAVIIYRLPNIMGKWCKPNYNSVVATFCYNISHNLPIRIDNENTILSLVYIDDLVFSMLSFITGSDRPEGKALYPSIEPTYEILLKDLVTTLEGFRNSRESHLIDNVGTGLKRALYSTYISYLDESDFSYPLEAHRDSRGAFVEFLKTKDSGQFSFFTAKPGVSRGRHYHHTKTEKFLVVQGNACFKFRQLHTETFHELNVNETVPTVVESIPGWAHDVTNIGENTLIVLLWSSELFDTTRPDTIPREI